MANGRQLRRQSQQSILAVTTSYRGGSFYKIGIKAAMLSGVAAISLTGMGSAALADGCGPLAAGQVVCDGNLSGGVSLTYAGPTTGAIIRNLSGNIAPASGTSGVAILSSGGAVVAVDTDAYSIAATGADADGINIVEWNTGDVSLEVTGDVSSAQSDGIYASANGGAVTVETTGNIAGGENGIEALSFGSGVVHLDLDGTVSGLNGYGVVATTSGAIEVVSTADISSGNDSVTGDDAMHFVGFGAGGVEIEQTGDVTSHGGNAVFASSAFGGIELTSDGALTATGGDGIHLEGYATGSIDVDHTGNITASDDGVDVVTQGAVTVDVTGDIDSGNAAIKAHNTGSDAMTITHDGVIDAGGVGIDASTAGAALVVTNTGNIDAVNDGISATVAGAGSVTVSQTGTITSTAGKGLVANSSNGAVNVLASGTIEAESDALSARSASSNVDVSQTGNILSHNGTGISLVAPIGSVTLDGAGTIDGAAYGVKLYSTGTGSDVNFTHDSGAITAHIGTAVDAFASRGNVTIENHSDVTGATNGIRAETTGANTDAIILQYGDVTANTAGSGSYNALYAQSDTGNATITGSGTVLMQGKGDAVVASINSRDKLSSVTWDGNVTAIDGSAVNAFAAAGGINLDLTGDFTANSAVGSNDVNTISALTYGGGDLVIAVDGDVSRGFTPGGTTGRAISAVSRGNSGITVNTTGQITSSGTGIYADSLGSRAISVNHLGDITAGYNDQSVTDATADGVHVSATSAQVDVTTQGDITAAKDGISISSLGSLSPLTVQHTGSITSGRDGVHVSTLGAKVGITTEGDITAVGTGIYAQATDNIDITVDGGVVSGANAIEFDGGFINSLTNYGTVESESGYAVKASNSNTSIVNYGLIKGNMLLSAWDNEVLNATDAEFDMGTEVNLGAWNILTNDGLIKIGTNNEIANTALTGSLENNPDGVLAYDINMALEDADQITITDGEALLDGGVALHFAALSNTLPQSYTLVSAEDGVTLLGIETLNPFVLNTITNPDDQSAVLNITGFDFAPEGIIGNGRQVGLHLTDAFPRVGTDLSELTAALASLTSIEDGQAALDQLSPEVELDRKLADLRFAQGFSDGLMSCPSAAEGHTWTTETSCGWVRVQSLSFSGDTENALSAFSADGSRIAAGEQFAIGSDLWLGLAAGVSSTDLATDAGATSNGQSFDAGAVLKYNSGPLLLAAAISGGHGSYAVQRSVDFEGFTDTLSSTRDHDTVNARLRAAYSIDSGSLYLRPSLDVNATMVTTAAGVETGGDAALAFGAEHSTMVSFSPALEIGLNSGEIDGWQTRSWLRVKQTLQSTDTQTLTAAFAGADLASDAFTVAGLKEDRFTTVSLGVDLRDAGNTNLQLIYDTQLGAVTTASTISAKFSLRF